MKPSINRLLVSDTPCPCGRPHPISLRRLVIKRDALRQIPEVISALGDFHHLVMICDDNTYPAAGARVESFCAPLWRCDGKTFTTLCLPTPPEGLHATETVAETVMSALTDADLLLAVGSGTIHDITRFAATQRNVDFVSIPTAASVDGFCSSVAAMTWKGFKKTFTAVAPRIVIADIDIIKKAPIRLARSGFGDMIGKYVALTEWKIANLLTGEFYCARIADIMEQATQAVLDSADGLAKGELSAFEALTYGLLLSGIAMQMMGNSRPASGGEHQQLVHRRAESAHGAKPWRHHEGASFR